MNQFSDDQEAASASSKSPSDYQAPDIEEVVSLDEIEQELLYAGVVPAGSGVEFD